MGLADKVIKRLEEQAETLAELRRLEEKHRGRIYDLEGILKRTSEAQKPLLAENETLRQENENLKIELNCKPRKVGE